MCRDKGKDSEKGNHAATHLFNQESMCRGQGSGAEEVVRAATHHFTRKTVYREHTEREKRRCDAVTHHFGKKIVCRDKGKDSEKGNHAATHLFTRKNRVSLAWRGRKRRTEATPHCTTRYDHPTKPHHIISHHITTISKPDNTTNRQNPIPCLKHHTPPHYTTKALPPKNWRKSFINLSANRLS